MRVLFHDVDMASPKRRILRELAFDTHEIGIGR
jgi:hypothetical protein